jgi:tRNA modification GTPase
MTTADTIFALSSGAPPAAIGIIRISGPHAFDAVQALAGHVPNARRASLVDLKHPDDGGLLDRALVLIFPGPNSASGEDLAELHIHGGRAVVRALESTLAVLPGLRPAEPGEFTRRAFLNGRIDLNEAEALADLLSAETEWQRRAANMMMAGGFTTAIEQWRKELLSLSALTEAQLDFSDEDDVEVPDYAFISVRCQRFYDSIDQLLSSPAAEKLRDGLRVVLGGPPNCGKSTLLNALVSRDAAIVSDIAGTTRDVIEVPVALSGIPFVFIDTAGLRETSDDAIERIGIGRTRTEMARADLVLWLGDEGNGPENVPLIEIDAKADQAQSGRKSPKAIRISALTGEGIADLVDKIVSEAKTMLPPPDQFAINQRQKALLAECASSLAEAAEAVDLLIVGECLRRARLALDALTGRTHTEDLLDTLFGKFCIGK